MLTIPEDIIIRYFQHNATEEESQYLHQWLREDEKNVKLFCQLEEIWNSRHTIDETVIRDGWERLNNQMEPGKLKIKPVARKKIPVWIRYTAAACIGILLVATIWISSENGIINLGKPVVQNVVFNRNGVEMLLLPDSSRIWINENSKITYPEEFSKKERVVQLEGKAYFDISKDERKPFIVRMNKIDVEVTGTEFFIETTPLRTLITLISGSVQVKRNDINKSASLTPGQEASITADKDDINITTVDTNFYVAWKDGTYRFDGEPFGEITKFLAWRFNLDINIAESLKEKRFTGRIDSEEGIHEVLDKISLSIPITYVITDEKATISER